jgi:hypothetical protein
MNREAEHTNKIHARIKQVYKKEHLKKAFEGINIALIFVLGLNVLVAFIEMFGTGGIESRTVMFYSFLGLSLLLILYFVILPLLRALSLIGKINYLSISEKIGTAFPLIKDDLRNALQLIYEDKQGNYSRELVEAAFEDVYKRSENSDFASIVTFGSLKKYMVSAAAGIIIAVILFAAFPGLRTASYRVLNHDREFVIPPKFKFDVIPGNKKIVNGESVKILVSAMGEIPESIVLSTRSAEQTSYQQRELLPDSLGRFIHTERNVKSSFKYFASAENIMSDVYNIEVINQPLITNLRLSIKPPRYSKLPEVLQQDNGNIVALPGTRVNIDIKSNKDLKEASIIFSDSSAASLVTDNKSASGSFRVYSSSTYRIKIIDGENNQNINPITYSINTTVDEHPEIEMLAPNENIKLGDNTNIALSASVSDDYGFSGLKLNYRLSESQLGIPWDEYASKDITISKADIEQNVYYVWDIEELVLAVDDVVSYYLEVFDNDNINGPKSAKTKLFTIRVPSINELYAEAEKVQQESELDLAETLKEAEELEKELEKISNELKQDKKELTWEEKEKIEEAVQKFQELGEKVQKTQEKLDEMRKDLQENNLLSEETLQKYLELQELMDELNSDELQSALERMQEMLKNLNRNQNQQAFEEMQFNEEMFKKSLERTLNLLKRIQIEQKVDEIVKRTEDLAEKMEELAEQTEKSDLSDNQEREDLASKQNKATEDLEKLQEEMEKLRDKMSEFDDMPMDEMQKMLDQMNEQQNREMSEQTSQQLQQQQQMQAMQNQQQMSQNMQSMMQQMMNMQQQMQQQSQMQTMYEMMRAINSLISLSKEQEEIKENTKIMSATSPQMRENAQKQNDLQRGLDKVLQQLSDLSQKSFAITPEMGRALGKARSEMNQSVSALQNRNSSMAVQRQNGAMKNLNEAANLLQGNMEQMMNGGQGGGMMSMMQQMQQLSQQQMNLNQLTQQLNEGELSQQQRAQLQRLAQQQDAIRKSLDQLNKESREAGQSKKLAASLEKILSEMKEVVTKMNTEKVNDDLVQSQERILSKLLDAQRSINERDFEERRESITGNTFDRESPPEIIFSSEEGIDKLRDELMKAIKEGYSKDYEELIKRYYEELQKLETNN